ncbi:Snf7-domain-containing protein [Russula ochroleuca]|jgi:charged multivesicular body protein 6|uniref:Snf7-domain-containing protein n=1 Tax=Russula ochroleuca TaxID=152965 RepID=A0A9P5MY10_9AGAM|nr:Snf7-domain-containing protein [Russula ochroleuca]
MGGTQSTPKITAQDRAILDLKIQRDKLKQYQKKIQVVLEREHEIAKQQLAAGHKDRALVALRRRKYQEGLLVRTGGQLESLEQMVSTIEFSLVEVSVLHGLKQGNEVLKEIHKQLNVESVEKLLEETAEAREYQREIDNMLTNSLSLDEEEAVQTELMALQQGTLLTQGNAETLPSLPNAPTAEPVSSEQVESRRHEEESATERVAMLA